MPRKQTTQAAAATAKDDDAADSFTHRQVKARDTAPPTTSAPASVFQLGQRAKAEGRKTRAAPEKLDPLAVPIRKGVPLPSTNGGPGSVPRYMQLAQRMEPGDSVELNERAAKTLANLARKAGMKMTVRKLPEGKFGVWRLK